MKIPKKINEASYFHVGAPLIFTKFLLLSVSVYSFEPLSNNFKPQISRIQYTKDDFLFFTNISLFYTTFCVIVGFLKQLAPTLNKLHRFLLPTSIVLEMMVTTFFWILFLINPSLVKKDFNKSGFSLLSLYTEFPKHLFPLLILMIEQAGMKLERMWTHKLFFIGFGIFYGSLSEILIISESNYLYPFFKKFSFKGRILFFVASILINFFFYEVLMYFQGLMRRVRYPQNFIKKK